VAERTEEYQVPGRSAVIRRKALRPEESRGVGAIVAAAVVGAGQAPVVLPALSRRRLELLQKELVIALQARAWARAGGQDIRDKAALGASHESTDGAAKQHVK